MADARGSFPLLAPTSEVAGRLWIEAGATALQKADCELGVLLRRGARRLSGEGSNYRRWGRGLQAGVSK